MRSVQAKYGYAMTLSACLWTGAFPLLHGGTYASLTYDKWTVMLVLAAVTLLCFCFDSVHRSVLRGKQKASAGPGRFPVRSRIRPLLPFFLAAALLLWRFLSCLLGPCGPDVWWQGASVRCEGLASQLCYFVLFSCFFFCRVNLKPVLLSAAAGAAVFFVIVMMQRSGGNPFGLYPKGRSYELNPEFQGTIGNIDMCTAYLLLLAGLFHQCLTGLLQGIGRLRHSGRSAAKPGKLSPLSVLLTAAGITALLVSVFLIATMGVQFGVVSLGVLFLVILLRFLPKKFRLPVLAVLILLALLLVWFWPGQGGGVWELHEILHGRMRLSFGSNRLAVWCYSLGLARENLLLGGGSATFRQRFNQYLADNSLAIPTEQDGVPLPDFFDVPHNEYIAQLTDHGIPALLLMLALIFLSVFRRREKWLPLLSPSSAAVLCYAVQAFFSFSVCIVAPLFWVLLAISFRE